MSFTEGISKGASQLGLKAAAGKIIAMNNAIAAAGGQVVDLIDEKVIHEINKDEVSHSPEEGTKTLVTKLKDKKAAAAAAAEEEEEEVEEEGPRGGVFTRLIKGVTNRLYSTLYSLYTGLTLHCTHYTPRLLKDPRFDNCMLVVIIFRWAINRLYY
jgi:hypothetical protein